MNPSIFNDFHWQIAIISIFIWTWDNRDRGHGPFVQSWPSAYTCFLMATPMTSLRHWGIALIRLYSRAPRAPQLVPKSSMGPSPLVVLSPLFYLFTFHFIYPPSRPPVMIKNHRPAHLFFLWIIQVKLPTILSN